MQFHGKWMLRNNEDILPGKSTNWGNYPFFEMLALFKVEPS